jgi:nicotinamidase-related amidase
MRLAAAKELSPMQALVVLDVQNEFSARGQRAVPNHAVALTAIQRRIDEARQQGRPIAFLRHHNRPTEAPIFRPGTWGAEYSPGIGPRPGRVLETEFAKDVFGAFSGTELGSWLERIGCDAVLLVGFFAHMCVSTTAREALMRGLAVEVDPQATGGYPLDHPILGAQSAEEVTRSALLQLSHMGVSIASSNSG